MRRFRQLCEEHRHRVYTFARYYLGNREDAEDATQEVLLRLWRHGLELPAADLPRWITRVARNACLDLLRRRRTRREVEDPPELATAGPGPDAALEAAQFRRRLEEAVATARRDRVEAVVGLGGRSALDVAKLAAVLAVDSRRIGDLYGIARVGIRLRLICF